MSDNFLNDLVTFFSKTVIKNSAMASEYETKSSKEKARIFLSAYESSDSFLTYENLYTKEDLLYHGVPLTEVEFYLVNLNLLPDDIKEKLMLQKRNDVIRNYEEENQYYRMLNGLPPLGIEPLKIKGKYVTDLTIEEVVYKYQKELDTLKANNPKLSYRYLHYLGENKIDIYSARRARNLEILYYHNYTFDNYLNRKIIELYYETAAYFESVFYSNAFEGHHRYSHFLIVAIVFSTINKVLSEPIRLSIRGEFNDIEVLRDIFLSYNLPFDPLVPKRYLQRIVKNINGLFSYKGTNQVLIDIVALFGYDKISLNKYYLIKELKKDSHGNFIFSAEKPEDRYELNFLEIPIDDSLDNGLFNRDIKRVEYEILTQDDPFWGGSEKVRTKQKLLETDFNYYNTKYLAINTMTNISQILQETCYFFNFINSAKEANFIDELEIVDTEIKESSLPIKLFNLIVAMNILICRKLKYEDIIIYASTGISTLYGFNFKGNEEQMKSILDKYPNFASKTKFGQVRSLFRNAPYTRNDLVEIFFNNLDYKADLEKALIECNDKQEYDMLYEIYKYNCYSEAVHSIFYSEEKQKYYRKYSEYLYDKDLELYNFVERYIKEQDCETALQKLFDCADLYLEDMRFTSMFLNSNISDRLRQYIFALLSYFKAYTVDIKNFNVFYLIDDEFANSIKLIDQMTKVKKELSMADSTFLDYYEKLIIKNRKDRSDNLINDFIDKIINYVYDIKDEDLVFKGDDTYYYKEIIRSSYNEMSEFIVSKIKHRSENIRFNEELNKTINKEDLILDIYDIIQFISQKMYAEVLLKSDAITEVVKYKEDKFDLNDSVLNNIKQKNIMCLSDSIEIVSFD